MGPSLPPTIFFVKMGEIVGWGGEGSRRIAVLDPTNLFRLNQSIPPAVEVPGH
jgi:hypothetical protein